MKLSSKVETFLMLESVFLPMMLPSTLFGATSRHCSEPRTWVKAGPESVSLPNGEIYNFPIEYNKWSAAGVLFPAPIEPLRSELPDQLSPIHISPRTGLVAMASIDYRDVVGVEPYNEFAVMIPARESEAGTRTGSEVGDGLLATVRLGLGGLMGADVLSSEIGSYIHYMPVTTEDAYELGVGGWEFPKEIADISIEDSTHTRRTRISIDGDHLITLQSRLLRRESRYLSDSYQIYSERNGTLLRASVQFGGKIGVRPLDPRASYTLGEHPRADIIRRLEVGSRPVAQLYAGNIRSSLHPSEELR